ncbi:MULTISPECIES: hypothetical protein [unclassified Microcoleus]|jgi:hypothetical protein|uniref:hypothetical protein n=1 Tax=unclassified Microcoleus TaxID=2642155 RepID=UPI001E19E996|nr:MULTISPECIES: hypothetical protein [unclassified Microcoleus]MCC3421746.1 hypothetical protein [Microcoleus sp. PH2017_07_MST_O_A]MCC3431178.1 hypothetical protein [Microcoleus sp. PH2017_04_SCI_O_A]MCC3444027.1 hypothetical protein [Microcoleus sp. PH2017_03_ELD_O_A]MCC3465106.1 hypothetical protein [Microcoleus sp. PH2017_06_SFM_O_A]MCC3504073.1 hypothetical protein [Microcoleus sp. PH2017_19_SFW_U_A]MCC3511367.1 hypothetical protein [Microcoleus sp. PH2017_17_BER_D_A]TAE13548.1 MAG: hy
MNPERQEAYLNLIERVLTCPNGQEPEVLSSCSDLIDAGFVQMLIQISASMAREGDEDTANFLVQLARLLGKSLGLSPDVVPASYSRAQ